MSILATSQPREPLRSYPYWPINTKALAAEALAQSTEIQSWWARQLGGLSFRQERGSGLGWNLKLAWPHGQMTCWVGAKESPYLASVLSGVDTQDPSWLNACLAHAPLPGIEKLVGMTISSCVPAEAADTAWLGWRLGPIQVLPLECDSNLLQSWWRDAAGSPTWERLAVPGRLVLHHRRWTPAQWRSLRCGDAVLIGALHEHCLRGLCYWGLTCEVGGWVELNWETQEMKWISDVQGTADLAAVGSIGQTGDAQSIERLEIPVSFELDTVRLPLSHLKQLHPGQVIPMAFAVHDGIVRLMSLGHCLATGRLVEVEGQLAVCLIHLGEMPSGG